MSVMRVHPAPSLRQDDRSSIDSYESALWALVKIRVDPHISDESYYVAAKLVADIFWRTDKAVLASVMKLSKQIEV